MQGGGRGVINQPPGRPRTGRGQASPLHFWDDGYFRGDVGACHNTITQPVCLRVLVGRG